MEFNSWFVVAILVLLLLSLIMDYQFWYMKAKETFYKTFNFNKLNLNYNCVFLCLALIVNVSQEELLSKNGEMMPARGLTDQEIEQQMYLAGLLNVKQVSTLDQFMASTQQDRHNTTKQAILQIRPFKECPFRLHAVVLNVTKTNLFGNYYQIVDPQPPPAHPSRLQHDVSKMEIASVFTFDKPECFNEVSKYHRWDDDINIRMLTYQLSKLRLQ